jgi:hypothetical protein
VVRVKNEQGRVAGDGTEVALDRALADIDAPVFGAVEPHAATTPTTENEQRKRPRERTAVRTVG